MATYLLFAFDDCYPAGGMGDCIGMFEVDADDDAKLQAHKVIRELNKYYDNISLVKLADGTWVEVLRGDARYHGGQRSYSFV